MATLQQYMDLVDHIAEGLKSGKSFYGVRMSLKPYSSREIYLAIRLGIWAGKLKLERV